MAASAVNGSRFYRDFERTMRSNSSCGDFATGVTFTILMSSNSDSKYYIKTKTKTQPVIPRPRQRLNG